MSLPDRKVPLVREDERTGLMSAPWYEAMVALEDADSDEAAARAATDFVLAARLLALEAAPNVVAPTLLGAWVNFGAGYEAAGYTRSVNLIVSLRGLVAAGVIGTPIFQLPAGFRPANTELFAVVSNSVFGAVEVRADGNVVPIVGNNASLSLASITFRAA